MSTTSGNPEPWREGTAPLPTEVPVVPAEVLEAGLDAGLRNGLYAQTSLVEANDHFKNDLRIFLRAAAPILLADKEREIEMARAERDRQYDETVNQIARVGAAEARVAALEASLTCPDCVYCGVHRQRGDNAT